jgi:hypothetical protein
MRKSRIYPISLLLLGFLFLNGCNFNNDSAPSSDGMTPMKVKSDYAVKQLNIPTVKEEALKMDEVTSVRAVELNGLLYTAIEVKYFARLKLDKIQKDVKANLEKKYPQHQVKVSADQKIFLEIDQLEKLIEDEMLTNNQLQKKLSKLDKLMSETT